MSTAAKPRRPRQPRPMAVAEQIAATDEILQVMFWLRDEGLAQEVSPNDLAKWVGLAADEIEPLLVQMLGSRLVERVVVDSGAEEGVPRFRLTQAGREKGSAVSRRNSPSSPVRATSSTVIRRAIAKMSRASASP